ncbi:hypothetical protein EDB81DRAFT_59986 [Dactylonectria macrodidyma]|uniref:Uncharacterized protein n=1 Tax=Dactylonectria macrodidyma TaxID=307937 RepID=A0A9P9J3E6_9HYPO|nr:hypothetical protein EDB81DRAFT_59986 [Dactylonectria macrodidyma]
MITKTFISRVAPVPCQCSQPAPIYPRAPRTRRLRTRPLYTQTSSRIQILTIAHPPPTCVQTHERMIYTNFNPPHVQLTARFHAHPLGQAAPRQHPSSLIIPVQLSNYPSYLIIPALSKLTASPTLLVRPSSPVGSLAADLGHPCTPPALLVPLRPRLLLTFFSHSLPRVTQFKRSRIWIPARPLTPTSSSDMLVINTQISLQLIDTFLTSITREIR